MAHFKIYPLLLGYYESHPLVQITFGSGHGKRVKVAMLAFLIKGNDVTILVDTGCIENNPEWAAKYHKPVVKTPEMNLLPALTKLGESPETIDFLINTHLHWDHCYNNHLFPGKKIFLQKREIEYALDPYPFNYLSYETAHIGLRSPFFDTIHQFEYLYGDKTLLPGIQVVTLPGHSPGLQGVLVDTEKGQCLLASDCVSGYAMWEGNEYQKHFIGGVHTDIAEYYKTLDKIESINPAYLIAGHDTKVAEHESYPY
jgi:glyoxylase-like metal-dependent hydrolase (beta-lactamase superfamily II)